MIKCGNPEIARILKKLTEDELKTLMKHLIRMILSYLMEQTPGSHNPLLI